MSLFIRYLVIVLSILIAARFVSGITVVDLESALVAGLVLGALNLILRPILIIFTLPATILTLGFFILIINTMLFWGAALIVPGVHVEGFTAAFLGALIVSCVSLVIHRLVV